MEVTNKTALLHWAMEKQNALRAGNEEKYSQLLDHIENGNI